MRLCAERGWLPGSPGAQTMVPCLPTLLPRPKLTSSATHLVCCTQALLTPWAFSGFGPGLFSLVIGPAWHEHFSATNHALSILNAKGHALPALGGRVARSTSRGSAPCISHHDLGKQPVMDTIIFDAAPRMLHVPASSGRSSSKSNEAAAGNTETGGGQASWEGGVIAAWAVRLCFPREAVGQRRPAGSCQPPVTVTAPVIGRRPLCQGAAPGSTTPPLAATLWRLWARPSLTSLEGPPPWQ